MGAHLSNKYGLKLFVSAKGLQEMQWKLIQIEQLKNCRSNWWFDW